MHRTLIPCLWRDILEFLRMCSMSPCQPGNDWCFSLPDTVPILSIATLEATISLYTSMHRDPLPLLHQSPDTVINAARNASAWSSLPQRFTVIDLSQWDSIILGDGWNDTTWTWLVWSLVTFPKERVDALWVLVTTPELYQDTLFQVCRLIFASRDDCFRRSSCECLLHDVLHHAPLHR